MSAKNNQRLQKDDFGQLFEEHKNLVYKTAYLMYGNKDDADEALQEVFLLVFHSLGMYDPAKGALTTWLHRITINYCLGHKRKQRLQLDSLDENQNLASEESVEKRIQSVAARREIRKAIMQLSEKLRAVIVLRYYWELPYAEIASILDIPLGTVKSRLDLALHTLEKNIRISESSLILKDCQNGSVFYDL
ncbi:RNA polymerase sigma factor [Leptolinea tardivitalis]|uniref:RNA polymerase sigma factor n=1 Tax=Leptolinea tardivitalis TaxID=229920 RepID=UPI00130DA1D3|nr:RNA polymerase sigma factor [Leptolinea tardivitalis]